MSYRGGEDDDRFAANSVLRPDDEVGIDKVSANLYANVTKYHAQIGSNVNRDALQQLEWNLLAEAKTLFHQRKFEEALNTFTHCLAVTEKTRSRQDHAVRGAVIHNIASCLHNLGEMESAQAYYEQAIDAFKKAKTPVVERALYGDANKRRVEFVKERLVDISWGRKPDGDKYLDENGVKRPVAPVFGVVQDAPGELSVEWHAAPEDIPEPGLPQWAKDESAVARANQRDSEWSSGRGDRSASGIYGGNSSGSAERTASQPMNQGRGIDEGAAGDARDDSAQEAARKEWLQYHMKVGEWEEARELVVTQEEQEDLDYLIESEKRGHRNAPPVRRSEPSSAIGSATNTAHRPMAPSVPTAAAQPEPKLIDDEDIL